MIQLHASLLNIEQVKVDPEWALRIPANLALRRSVLPFTFENGKVLVACADEHDQQTFQAIARYIKFPLEPVVADPQALSRKIRSIFQDTVRWNGNPAEPVRIRFHADQPLDEDAANVVALGDEILHAALIRQATDIHIDPGKDRVYVRLRVDGALDEYRQLPTNVHGPLVSRLKVMSGMDIAERRAPQDGRFTLTSDHRNEIDIRVATIPAKHGERMTLRLLATNTDELTLDRLGMSHRDQVSFEQAINRPNGLVLLTGPTGCGKSTTLYAALRDLIQRKSLNIMTIEDPVEYLIDGISQVEVDTNDKVSFHKALRSLLRHDPDVLMIGEIRDEETAATAIKAALTGHLVFTTLHANSAISAVTRLADMNIKPFLIASVARLFAAQRLVRRLCPHCKVKTEMTDEQARAFNKENIVGMPVFQARGCKYCAGSGYLGRLGLFELVRFDQELAQFVSGHFSESELVQFLGDKNYRSLIDDGLEKIFAGETTVEQVIPIISPY